MADRSTDERNSLPQAKPHRRNILLSGGSLLAASVAASFLLDGAAPFMASQTIVAKFLDSFKDYPPSQRPSSFSIDQIVEKMQRSFETQ